MSISRLHDALATLVWNKQLQSWLSRRSRSHRPTNLKHLVSYSAAPCKYKSYTALFHPQPTVTPTVIPRLKPAQHNFRTWKIMRVLVSIPTHNCSFECLDEPTNLWHIGTNHFTRGYVIGTVLTQLLERAHRKSWSAKFTRSIPSRNYCNFGYVDKLIMAYLLTLTEASL